MKIDFHIKDEQTGETRIYKDDYEYDAEWTAEGTNATLFIWEEGNYACDCNRRLFFGRVNCEELTDTPCGEARYSVIGYNRETGAKVLESVRRAA